MCNSAMWVALPIVHDSSPVISFSETIYKMHVTIFFPGKSARHCDFLTALQRTQPQPLGKLLYK
jgi:hypothetical protein